MSEKPATPKDDAKKRKQAKLAAALKANIKRRKDEAKRIPATKD
jgi:hypothetical protein